MPMSAFSAPLVMDHADERHRRIEARRIALGDDAAPMHDDERPRVAGTRGIGLGEIRGHGRIERRSIDAVGDRAEIDPLAFGPKRLGSADGFTAMPCACLRNSASLAPSISVQPRPSR